MSKLFLSIDRFAVQMTKAVLRFRWLVILLATMLALAIGTGASRLEFSNNYRVFFSDENPELSAFEDLQATYTKNDNFLFVFEPSSGDAFSADTLTAVESLTEAAWQIPYALRVDSITNFQHTYGIDDDLIVEDLFRDPAAMDAAERQRRSEVAVAEPLLANQLIKEDGSATAVNVVLQYPEQSLTEVPEAVAYARELRDQIEASHPNIDVSLTGVSMLNNAFAETGVSDLGSIVPIMFGVILLLTLVIMRSIAATLATLAVIILSSVTAMGWAGFAEIKLTPISGSAPIIILTLAIADSIHILISLRGAMRAGMDKSNALVEALRLNFLPVGVTSITTVVGFLALNFSDSPPFWHLGNITAVGIIAAWILSITLLPALISLLPYRVAAQSGPGRGERSMARIAEFVIARPRQILVVMGLTTLTLISFIPTIDFNDQWTQYFGQKIEFRRDTDKAVEHFGMYPIEYSVPAADAGGVSDPEYLANLERLADFIRTQDGVTHVYSFSDIMKRLNKNLHGDDPSYYRTPDDRDQAAQYLLLYELSLPYGLDLNDRVNIDKSATRLTATMGDVDSVQTKALLANTRAWMEQNLPDYMQANATSAQVMFTYISDRNVSNMITGTIVAIVAISFILILSLQSLRLGLLSLIPNALPILTTFGAWALLVGEVGFSVSVIASISLGIIVDDTVHLLSKYVRARRERGGTAADAIRYAFQNVGVAIVVNTIVLSVGFLVMLTSAFKVNADMGLLTAMAIVFALILDFLFLPALLLFIDRARINEPNKGNNPMSTNKPATAHVGLIAAAAISVASAIGMTSVAEAAETTPVRGSSPEAQKGFEIAARSDRSDRGFGDSDVELEMVLRNAAGKESRRSLRITTLEVTDEDYGDKSMIVFDSPNDVKGTALLSHANILEADNQWLFLPSLKRVKRISSANKSGPFVGSEFAFEDFTSLELNKYDYTFLREEELDGRNTDVVERTPRYENSGYTRQISWIDQADHQVRKVEFYDRRDTLLKTLTLTDYKPYDGVWRAHKMTMTNHKTGKSTDLLYSDYVFGVGLSDSDFEKARLTRLR